MRLGRGAHRGRTLVLLLHGHGTDEADIFPLSAHFPPEATVAALRGPIVADGGFRWYAHHDVGRPVATSLAAGRAYVEGWLDACAAGVNSVWLAGFSGGAMMAGALLLANPHRFAGIAMLHGALPLDAEVPLEPGRLAGCEVFYGYGEADVVIPRDLVDRSCTYLQEASGANAVVRGYRAGHAIPPAEERDLARWYASLT